MPVILSTEEAINLPSPSEEQLEVINQVTLGNNVKIQAVAGAGKTTTLLHCSRAIYESSNGRTLILTYNKELADDTNKRIKGTPLANHTTVSTIHSYAAKLYGHREGGIFDDGKLRLRLHRRPLIDNNFAHVFIDEAQDLTSDYYKFISYLITPATQIVLVGDKRQSIYGYKGADVRYFSNYTHYFNNDKPWISLKLRTSYRLTPLVAEFVNTHILNKDLIISGNSKSVNCKVEYHRVNIFSDVDRIIINAINEYGPTHAVLMANSVKSKNSKNPLCRFLERQHRNLLFYTKDHNDDSDIKITKVNKTGLYTFHSMKGRERKCTILFGFDESYFAFGDRTWSKQEQSLPNVLYVAATRSTEKLIVIQSDCKDPFRTIKVDRLSATCNVYGDQMVVPPPSDDNSFTKSVINLTKHLGLDKISAALECFTCTAIQPAAEKLNYVGIIPFDDYYESVSSYYGTLIPMYTCGDPAIYSLDDCRMKDVIKHYNKLRNKLDKTMKEWMELSVIVRVVLDNIHFYKDQVRNFNWIDEKFIFEASKRLQDTLPPGGIYEHYCEIGPSLFDAELPRHIDLQGSFDYFTGTEIWELKLVSALTDEHKIQCAVYAALHYFKADEILPVKLYNYRTNEILEINVTDPLKLLLALWPAPVIASTNHAIPATRSTSVRLPIYTIPVIPSTPVRLPTSAIPAIPSIPALAPKITSLRIIRD